MYFAVIAVGLGLSGIALTFIWYTVKNTDFRRLYETAHKNSLWLFHLCSQHHLLSELLELNEFKWSGIATNTVIAAQGALLLGAVFLSVPVKNPFIFIPLFLLMREGFIVAAMFIRRKRVFAENSDFENMLRLFLAEFMQTKSKRDSLGRVTDRLTGIWRGAVGKLYRQLGNGGGNDEHYMEFAQTFPNNRHVRLLTQLLIYSDAYGGDISSSLTQLITDVMADRMESEKNKSETAATLFITLVINLGVAITAVVNIIMRPMVGEVLIGTVSGKILLAVSALCCFFSLRVSKKIVEE